VYELSSRLAEKYELMVVAPHAPGAKLVERIGRIGVHRFRYFFSRWQKLAYDGGILANLKRNALNYLLVPLFVIAEFIKLARLLKVSHIDVIHAHWLIPQGLVAVTARSLFSRDTRVICTSHGSDLFGLSGWFFKKVKQHVMKKADRVTVVSHAMRNYALSLIHRQDIEVLPMGVDLVDKFTPGSTRGKPNSFELLFVGRLVKQKGVHHIILAMSQILKRHPHTKLLIAGDGPELAALQQLVASNGLETHVRFLGAVKNVDLIEFYRRATVFVSASEQEGFGLAYVEALGCGCAVVAAELPAIRDIVIDGVTGTICKQRDSSDVALKVSYLLDQPSLRESLGKTGREHVLSQFDWRTISHRYQQLIDMPRASRR
jgi:glycosyltransferase involved in cell wall biosynthesis